MGCVALSLWPPWYPDNAERPNAGYPQLFLTTLVPVVCPATNLAMIVFYCNFRDFYKILSNAPLKKLSNLW